MAVKIAPGKTPKLPKLPIVKFRALTDNIGWHEERDRFGVLTVLDRLQQDSRTAAMDWRTLTTRHAFEPLDVPITFKEAVRLRVGTNTVDDFKWVVIPRKTTYRHRGPIDSWSTVHGLRSYALEWWQPLTCGTAGTGAIRCEGGFLTVEVDVDRARPGKITICRFRHFFPYALPDVGLAGSLDQPAYC